MSNRIRRPRISDAKGARMIELYYDGLTFAAIAERVGEVTPSGVRLYLIRAGVHRASSMTKTRARIEGAVNWYDRGVTVENILWHFKISAATLYRNVKRAGIPLRIPAVSVGMRQAFGGEYDA